MRTVRRRTTLTGIRATARRMAVELFLLSRDLPTRLRRVEVPAGPLQLNVGCGDDFRAGWVNVDLNSGADVRADLREPLPFPDGCASLVHGEHVFEHLEHPGETMRFLAECRRVLVPGGRLSLSVPDAGEALRRYAAEDHEWFAMAGRRWHPREHARTPMSQVNYVFRQGTEHRYAWDEETLLLALSDVGFERGRRRPAEEGLDSPSRVDGSLLVEAFR